MGDLALRWGTGCADLDVVADDLLSDAGLETAILLSLFTDRRAAVEDKLPGDGTDRRGWWADEFALADGDLIGSRLWQLDRSTRREDVLRDAEAFDREALAWLIEDRVTDRVDVTVTAISNGLSHAITIYRPTGDPATFRFSQAWEAQGAA